jgi:hypothetical protein
MALGYLMIGIADASFKDGGRFVSISNQTSPGFIHIHLYRFSSIQTAVTKAGDTLACTSHAR